MSSLFGDWDGSPADARRVQRQLAAQLVLRDRYATPLRRLAGFHVAFDEAGAGVRATAVLLDAGSLQVEDRHVVHRPAAGPGSADLVAFHALAAMREALEALAQRPDLALVDGHGVDHPHGLGLAAHFGLATGLPSIGVGRRILAGTSITSLHDMRGAFTPLRIEGRQVGWLLRSRVGSEPVVVSPGHGVSMASAPALVLACTRDDRLPEPTRLARQAEGWPGPGKP